MLDETELRERKRKMTVIHQAGAPIVLRSAVRRSSAPGKVRLQPQRVRYAIRMCGAQLERQICMLRRRRRRRLFPLEPPTHLKRERFPRSENVSH